jgi:hypothetical protein
VGASQFVGDLWSVPQRGCHGCFLSVVHSVRSMLAHRAVRASDLSFRLAVDVAVTYFRHLRSWGVEFDQRLVLSPREAASRTTRNLTCRRLRIDYPRVNERIAC